MTLNNHYPASITNGNDFAVDSLALTPLTPHTLTLTVKPGTISWQKAAEDGTTLLPGSVWSITGPGQSAEGTTIADCNATSADRCTGMDKDPTAGSFKLTDLPCGTYSIREATPPEGYVGITTPLTATISATSLDVNLGPVRNSPITGSITWKKTDDDGAALGGSEWTVTPTNATPGHAFTVIDNGQRDTDAIAGELKVDDLPYGTYTLTESKAPEGFTKTDTTYPFTIDSKATTVDINDGRPIINKRILGTVSWNKVDAADSALLGGSIWTLTRTDAQEADPITIEDCHAESAEQCTGEDKDPTAGKFHVANLAWGTYTLTEKQAPAGYYRNVPDQTITIDGQHTTIALGELKDTAITGTELPLTGGIGRGAFTIAGFAILGGGGAALTMFSVRKRHIASK